MSTKVVYYITIAYVLIQLFASLERVAVKFIESSNQETSSYIMMPGVMTPNGPMPIPMPNKSSAEESRHWAQK